MSKFKNITPVDLKEMKTADLLALFNELTSRKTKKFASREKGIAQTAKALVEHFKTGVSQTEKVPHGLSFRLPPRDLAKEPRIGTKRRATFMLLTSKDGGLFSEIAKLNKWTRKDAYEGIRLLNTYCGLGLWHEREGADDYRVFVVSPARYKQLVEREAAKS